MPEQHSVFNHHLSQGFSTLDIPRIFNITESAHRIHNPFTSEKLATLGAALRLERGTRVLDLGSGSGEMLCTWARDYGITGVGIDMSQRNSVLKNSKSQIESNSSTEMLSATSPRKRSAWRPVSVPHGSVGGSPEPSSFWPKAFAPEVSSSSVSPTGGNCLQRKMLPKLAMPMPSSTFSSFQNFSHLSATSTMTLWKWFWLTRKAGIDTRQPNGSLCDDGSKRTLTTTLQKKFEPS